MYQTECQRFIVALLLTLADLKFKIISQFCFEYHQMSLQRVKIAKIDSEHCLCHIRHDITGPLTALTQTSWRTLQHAASIPLDDVFTVPQNSCTDESKPIGAYHRQC